MGNEGVQLPCIIMFGDSLTEWSWDLPTGTGVVLEDRLRNKAEVLNRGLAGETTSSLQDYFKTNVLDSTVSNYTKAPLLITIWLGANDAVLPPSFAHVPLDRFEANICEYVNRILTQPGWETTCVLLITPPPINAGTTASDSSDEDDDLGPAFKAAKQEARRTAEEGIFHRTWKSKRKYAENVMEISRSYEGENAARVAGLDVWNLFIKTALAEQGREWVEEKLPGCGLPGSEGFANGWFTDGLHLGPKGYEAVTNGLLAVVEEKWPEMLKDT